MTTTPDSSSARALIGKLCDGEFCTEDIDRLNQTFLADPLFLDQLSDHLNLEGLLEFEFRSPPQASNGLTSRSITMSSVNLKKPQRRWPWLGLLVPSIAFLTSGIAIALMLGWQPEAIVQPLALQDSGFEQIEERNLPWTSRSPWYGDVADVVESFSGVTPMEGRHMVRFVRSAVDPERACEIYQVVPLQGLVTSDSDKRFAVEASASFNGVTQPLNEATFIFGISLFAFSESPAADQWMWPAGADKPLTFSGSQTPADGDAVSWQQVSTRLDLPENARYLIVQLVVSRTDGEGLGEEFPGQFADDVVLRLLADRDE